MHSLTNRILAVTSIFFSALIALNSQAALIIDEGDLRIWETPFTGAGGGGTYTVSVGPDLTIWGFGVTTNPDATEANTSRSGWTSALLTRQDWDNGFAIEQFDFFDEIDRSVMTGAGGIGSFGNVLGSGSLAAVFWAESYFASDLGPNATSSSFEWRFGDPASTAFALVSTPTSAVLVCSDVGLNDPGADPNQFSGQLAACTELGTTSNGIPAPATVWLFASVLLLSLRRFSKKTHAA